MVHGVSGEQVAYVGALAKSDLPELSERDNWHRFEYRHTDLTYPLYVRITDAQGPKLPWALEDTEPHRVWMVDFERTAMTEDGFRGETAREPLPFGMWVRVREAVEDAFRCWPTADPLGKHADRIILKGGWFGDWSPGIARLSAHRNNLFNRFGSKLQTDIPGQFVRFNIVPLDILPIRFWEEEPPNQYMENSDFLALKHVMARPDQFASYGSEANAPTLLRSKVFAGPHSVLISLSSGRHLAPNPDVSPPVNSPASKVCSLGIGIRQEYWDLFGHKSGLLNGRYYSPMNSTSCPTEIFINDPKANDFIAVNCFTSPEYGNLQDLPFTMESPELFWHKHKRRIVPYGNWRVGREGLEALFGSNENYRMHDLHFPKGVSTSTEPRRALMAGGSYVGGDLSFEPYCLTFIYTDQKPAGLEWIATRNPQVRTLASKLAEIYNIR